MFLLIQNYKINKACKFIHVVTYNRVNPAHSFRLKTDQIKLKINFKKNKYHINYSYKNMNTSQTQRLKQKSNLLT